MNITDFLLARIAEDEVAVRSRWNRDGVTDEEYWGTPLQPSRVLSESAAKRSIVEAWKRADTNADAYPGTDTGIELGLYEAVTHLAAVHADHPDYQQEWRP